MAEVDEWSDETFLNKAKVCISGKVTRTAIILLGRNEAEHFLSPAIARITWVLKDQNGIEKDYQHFGPPLIQAVDQVFAKVRNLTYRYLPNASLFPTEVTQYDPWVIRETFTIPSPTRTIRWVARSTWWKARTICCSLTSASSCREASRK